VTGSQQLGALPFGLVSYAGVEQVLHLLPDISFPFLPSQNILAYKGSEYALGTDQMLSGRRYP
jgi:hypothetical protein